MGHFKDPFQLHHFLDFISFPSSVVYSFCFHPIRWNSVVMVVAGCLSHGQFPAKLELEPTVQHPGTLLCSSVRVG